MKHKIILIYTDYFFRRKKDEVMMGEDGKRKLTKLTPKQKEGLEFMVSCNKIFKEQIEMRSLSDF